MYIEREKNKLPGGLENKHPGPANENTNGAIIRTMMPADSSMMKWKSVRWMIRKAYYKVKG